MQKTPKGLFKNYIHNRAHRLEKDGIILTNQRKERRKRGEKKKELLTLSFLPQTFVADYIEFKIERRKHLLEDPQSPG